MTIHDFHESNKIANSKSIIEELTRFYKKYISDKIRRTAGKSEENIHGVDVVVGQYKIDEKIRLEDYGDFLIERWSNVRTKKPGWTFDKTKITDIIVWVVPNKPFKLIPYELLRRAVERLEERWCTVSNRHIAYNKGYKTINHSIEWNELWSELETEDFSSFICDEHNLCSTYSFCKHTNRQLEADYA
jgi:hypothetical protein